MSVTLSTPDLETMSYVINVAIIPAGVVAYKYLKKIISSSKVAEALEQISVIKENVSVLIGLVQNLKTLLTYLKTALADGKITTEEAQTILNMGNDFLENENAQKAIAFCQKLLNE